jgi:hypothetical protein
VICQALPRGIYGRIGRSRVIKVTRFQNLTDLAVINDWLI